MFQKDEVKDKKFPGARRRCMCRSRGKTLCLVPRVIPQAQSPVMTRAHLCPALSFLDLSWRILRTAVMHEFSLNELHLLPVPALPCARFALRALHYFPVARGVAVGRYSKHPQELPANGVN